MMRRRDFIARVVMGGAVAFGVRTADNELVDVRSTEWYRRMKRRHDAGEFKTRRDLALGRMQRVVNELNLQLERFAQGSNLASEELRYLGKFVIDHEDAIKYKVGPS